MTSTRLLVGTPKGAFILDSDAERADWTVRGPLCEGWPIHDLIIEPASGAILAGGGSPWYGQAVWRSEDGGERWSHSSVRLLRLAPSLFPPLWPTLVPNLAVP